MRPDTLSGTLQEERIIVKSGLFKGVSGRRRNLIDKAAMKSRIWVTMLCFAVCLLISLVIVRRYDERWAEIDHRYRKKPETREVRATPRPPSSGETTPEVETGEIAEASYTKEATTGTPPAAADDETVETAETTTPIDGDLSPDETEVKTETEPSFSQSTSTRTAPNETPRVDEPGDSPPIDPEEGGTAAFEPAETARSDRFIAYDNGIVIDTRSGLMWASTDGGFMNRTEALRYCDEFAGGGYTDWRIPTLAELTFLFAPDDADPDRGDLREFITLDDCCLWAVEWDGPMATVFDHQTKTAFGVFPAADRIGGVLPVRTEGAMKIPPDI